jgi:hypothetical protein
VVNHRITQDGLSALEQELARASFGPLASEEGMDDAAPDALAARTIAELAKLAGNPHIDAWRDRIDAMKSRNAIAKPLRPCGRLTRAAGLVLEAVGLKMGVGSECMIELPPGSAIPTAEAEVVASIRSKARRSTIRWRARSVCRSAGNCWAAWSMRPADRSTDSARSAPKPMRRCPRRSSIR